jgi:hypothetical protein
VVDRRADPGPEDPKVDIRIVEGAPKPEPVAVPVGDEPAAEAGGEQPEE